MRHVAAVSVDCEGCEPGALWGGWRWLGGELGPAPCFVELEVTQGWWLERGFSVLGLVARMDALGFTAAWMNPLLYSSLRPTLHDWEAWVHSHDANPLEQGQLAFVRRDFLACLKQFAASRSAAQ